MFDFKEYVLKRERVTRTLYEALQTYALVVLTAPAGYGKSTAASQLAAVETKKTFCISVRSGVNSPDYLWDAACLRLGEQGSGVGLALRRMGLPSDDAKLFGALEICRKKLWNSPSLLIIDDYQNAGFPELNNFLVSLVREEIPDFNILLLSRTRPEMELGDLALKGLATVFGQELLVFSHDETVQLFESAGVDDLKAAELAEGLSEGWAAALMLSLHSYMAGDEAEPLNDLERLISESFFSQYTGREQSYLMIMSILGSVTPEQFVFMTQDPSAPLVLRDMCNRNSLISYNADSDSYSLHSLLRTFLQKKIREQPPGKLDGQGKGRALDLPELYRRAGECCLRESDCLRAVKFFAQAGQDGDLLRILQLFQTPDEGVFINYDPEGVLSVIKSIPWSIRLQCPIGYLGFIHRYLVRVSRSAAASMLEEAGRRFTAEGALSPDVMTAVRGEIEIIRAALSFNDFEAMCRCYENACKLLQGRSCLVNEQMLWTFSCPHSAFLYLREPGGYGRLLKLANDKFRYFEEVSGGANAGTQDLLEAEYRLETGKMRDATHLLLKAGYRAEEHRHSEAMLAVSFTRARMFLADRRVGAAWEEVERCAEIAGQSGNPLHRHSMLLCRGYIAAVCNKIDEIPACFATGAGPEVPSFFENEVFSHIVRGKALMAAGDWTRLEAHAERVFEGMKRLKLVYGQIHVRIFQAVAAMHTRSHRTDRADAYMSAVRDLSAPDGIVTCIAEYGAHLYPLLQRLRNIYPYDENLVMLGRLTKKYAKLGAEGSTSLTLRERDVLECAATGASNGDIGKELGITTGSVANTLTRIYTKLGVGSRVEAVRKWAELERSIYKK